MLTQEYLRISSGEAKWKLLWNLIDLLHWT